MTWIYQGEPHIEVPEGALGFIYIITNLSNNRRYLGKKKFWNKKTSIKTVTLKNGNKKKKKIRSLIPSDWIDYWSSSTELQADVEKLGKDTFTREIIHLCKSDGVMTYLETKEIFTRECLESDMWYNGWVMCRVRKDHIKGKLNFTTT